ncbi:MAG TPA: hypothetical protein VLK58_01640 [Conexibacter sp.]|nr:hypothetical protein [Conexibacter sp.]
MLAIGPGAVVSHRDAARLHNLRPGNHQQIDVATTRCGRSTDRIRVHRTTVLTPDDITRIDDVPVTSAIETEDLFSAFVDARGLPRPELNAIVEGDEVDACACARPGASPDRPPT